MTRLARFVRRWRHTLLLALLLTGLAALVALRLHHGCTLETAPFHRNHWTCP